MAVAVEPLLLTINESAKFLAVSPSAVRKWAKSGVIPIVRIGRCTRIARSDLLALIETRRTRFPMG